MNFSTIFQLGTKKLWWVDVLFYFVMSLLVATILCYFIFLFKNSLQRNDIIKENEALLTVGTDQQKGYEESVISYQKKISDFSGLFKNHDFASNVFYFMQKQTMPNIWFKQFSLNKASGGVQLVGESDDLDAFSRQLAYFERNEHVKSLGSLNSSIGDSARTQFTLSLVLDQSIFTYIADAEKEPVSESPEETNQENQQSAETQEGAEVLPEGVVEEAVNSSKLIVSFNLLSTPQVVGIIDQEKHEVSLSVPYGTDVKNLMPAITLSTGATVLPLSNVPQNFSIPVVYRVTAQDGSAQDYKITVNVLPEVVNESAKAGLNFWVVLLIVLTVMAVIAVIIFFVWRKMKNQKLKLNQGT